MTQHLLTIRNGGSHNAMVMVIHSTNCSCKFILFRFQAQHLHRYHAIDTSGAPPLGGESLHDIMRHISAEMKEKKSSL
jgi:hypothetical protein